MKKLVLCTFAIMLMACAGTAGNTAAEAGYSKGALTATSFESEYIGVRFSLPDGYILASAQELDALIDVGAGMAGIDQAMIDYATATTVYEMMVAAPMGMPNLMLMVEKLTLSNMTEEQYIEALKSGLATVPNIRYNAFSSTSSTRLAGQEYRQITAEATISGFEIMQDYIIRKQGERIIGFIVTYSKGSVNERNALLAGFTRF